MTAQVAVVPAVLALFFFVVQVSLWFYGRTVATSAAQHGLDAARVDGGNPAAGDAIANEFLDQVGGFQETPEVAVSNDGETITVTVSGEPIDAWPLFTDLVDFPPEIEVEVSGPVERVVD